MRSGGHEVLCGIGWGMSRVLQRLVIVLRGVVLVDVGERAPGFAQGVLECGRG